MNTKIARSAGVAIMVGIGVLVNCGSAAAITPSLPPSREHVAQAWVGFSVDAASTLRIDLKADGTGSGILLSGDEPKRFQVTAWTLKSDSLELSIHFKDPDIETSRLAGKFKT